jgi:hypothetical protein
MPTTTTATPTCTKARKAILPPCPMCGEETASVLLRLANLDESDCEFQCVECDAEFSADHVRILIAKWSKLLAWIDAAPSMEDE